MKLLVSRIKLLFLKIKLLFIDSESRRQELSTAAPKAFRCAPEEDAPEQSNQSNVLQPIL